MITRLLNVDAELVKPRDIVAVRESRAVSVSNVEEFYTTIRFKHQPPLRISKFATVTVYRKLES